MVNESESIAKPDNSLFKPSEFFADLNNNGHELNQIKSLPPMRDGQEKLLHEIIDDRIDEDIKKALPDLWSYTNAIARMTFTPPEKAGYHEWRILDHQLRAQYNSRLSKYTPEFSNHLNNMADFARFALYSGISGQERKTQQTQIISQISESRSMQLEQAGPRQGILGKAANLLQGGNKGSQG